MDLAAPLWDVHNHQGWSQLGELGLALVLSTLIGWEPGCARTRWSASPAP